MSYREWESPVSRARQRAVTCQFTARVASSDRLTVVKAALTQRPSRALVDGRLHMHGTPKRTLWSSVSKLDITRMVGEGSSLMKFSRITASNLVHIM